MSEALLQASLRSIMSTPAVGLVLAISAVLSLIFGIWSVVRAERIQQKLNKSYREGQDAVIEAIEKVFSHTSPPAQSGERGLEAPQAPRQRVPGSVASKPSAPSTDYRRSADGFPRGVEAIGELPSPNRPGNDSVVLVQNQRWDGGATLLIFGWHGFDLSVRCELSNRTGATFEARLGDDAKSINIETLDIIDSTLVQRQFVWDGRNPPTEGSEATPAEIVGWFQAPSWSTIGEHRDT